MHAKIVGMCTLGKAAAGAGEGWAEPGGLGEEWLDSGPGPSGLVPVVLPLLYGERISTYCTGCCPG